MQEADFIFSPDILFMPITLSLLRNDFNSTDFNRKTLYAHVIPTLVILLCIFLFTATSTLIHFNIPIFLIFILAIVTAIIVRQYLRKLLPDYVRPADIIGNITITDEGNLEVISNEENFLLQKGSFKVESFKHNYSKETRLGRRDEGYNGIAVLCIECAGAKKLFKFIIDTDDQLKIVRNNFSKSPRIPSWDYRG